MNDPFEQLRGEHDHALSRLQVLRISARGMEKSGMTPELLSGFRSAVAFLDTEIRDHNRWEEEHLFPLIERYTGPRGPCAVMRAEHRQLWNIYEAIKPLLTKVESGMDEAADRARLSDLAEGIVDLLVNHIHKENEILFPMGRRMLTAGDIDKLLAARPS